MRYLEKYKKLSDPVKSSIWFVIASVFQKGISLITTPIFTRILTTEQYGVFSVYQSWYSIISIFATLNLSYGVYNNGLTKYPDERKRYTSSMQGLSSCITIILFIVYMFSCDYWNKLLNLSSVFILAMFIECLFTPAYSFWSVEQRYNYRYKTLIGISLLTALISPIIGIFAVLSTDYKAEARVLSSVFVQVAIGLIFYILNFMRGRQFINWKYWKYALTFNIPLIPHYMSGIVLQQADRIMVSNMIGKEEAGIYSVAYSVATIMTIISSSINSSFIPYTYKALKEEKYKCIGENATPLLLLVGGSCIVVTALGPEVVKIFAPSDYYPAIWIIPPVAMSVYFMFLYPLFGNIEFYFEQTKFIMVASCVGAITNVILNYWLIPIFGFYAAGYTTLFCYILFSIAHYFVYERIRKKRCNGHKIYDIKLICIFSILLLFAMGGVTLTYNHIILRYIIIILMCVVAVIKRKYLISKIKEIGKR